MLFNGMLFAFDETFILPCHQSMANPFAARLSFIINIHISNAALERTAERRHRQSEGTDALWA